MDNEIKLENSTAEKIAKVASSPCPFCASSKIWLSQYRNSEALYKIGGYNPSYLLLGPIHTLIKCEDCKLTILDITSPAKNLVECKPVENLRFVAG